MLVIRDAQVEALNRQARKNFEIRLAESLANTFPERFPDAVSPVTVEFARRAIAVALQHGITTEHPVALLANLRATFGENFEWTPVASDALALLADPSLPGPIKVSAIRDCLYSATGGRAIILVPDQQS